MNVKAAARVAEVFGFLASETRLRLLHALERNGEFSPTALALLLAFAGSSFAADTNAPSKVTIAELLVKPERYAGKEVSVKAGLADVCASDGCLTLKDKFDMIEGKPPAEGFKKTPKAGAMLNVTGTVTVKGER